MNLTKRKNGNWHGYHKGYNVTIHPRGRLLYSDRPRDIPIFYGCIIYKGNQFIAGEGFHTSSIRTIGAAKKWAATQINNHIKPGTGN